MSERPPLTERQTEILGWIRERVRMYGPTIREIAKAHGIKTTNGVVCHLRALERKGYVRRTAGKARALEVLDVI